MQRETGTFTVKSGLAEMLKGGVIMDVTTADQAKIAEDAGACAVMALERVPADIRRDGGVARMADATKVEEIQQVVSIPVMAKARIGHFVEAQILQALGVDYVDESEVLTPADEEYHIDKWAFTVPFVCGARNLGEALRRIAEGAAMIRTKGEAGTGNVVEAVRHERRSCATSPRSPRCGPSSTSRRPRSWAHRSSWSAWWPSRASCPCVNFSAGGIATPADAALMMQLGGRRRVRGLGHLQVPGPRHDGACRRRGHHELPGPDVLAKLSPRPRRPDGRARDREAGDPLQDRGW